MAFCLLPLWESVIVLCFVVRYFMSILVLMGKRELIALLNLSSWCLVMVERLFLAVPRGCLRFVIVVFPDYTHLLFFCKFRNKILLSNTTDRNVSQHCYRIFDLILAR